MRLVTALALLVVVLLASPAFAQKKEMDMSSEGQVTQYGGIAAYLASDASAYHTGDTIVIDGGRKINL